MAKTPAGHHTLYPACAYPPGFWTEFRNLPCFRFNPIGKAAHRILHLTFDPVVVKARPRVSEKEARSFMKLYKEGKCGCEHHAPYVSPG